MPRYRISLFTPFVLAILLGCADEPTSPRAAARPLTAQVGESTLQSFYYYYAGHPIYLEIDPERFVVVSEDEAPVAVATQVLARIGVAVTGAQSLPQARRHYLLRLRGASAAASRQAADVSRSIDRGGFGVDP